VKKPLICAVIASLVFAPTFAVAQQHRGSGYLAPARGPVVKRPAPNYRAWRQGERFDPRHAQNYQVIDYRRYRGLRAPPPGYRYVRSGNDAVLVGIASGLVSAVIAGAIR